MARIAIIGSGSQDLGALRELAKVLDMELVRDSAVLEMELSKVELPPPIVPFSKTEANRAHEKRVRNFDPRKGRF